MLAIAGCQPPGFLTVPSPSRAGSLPQFFWGDRKIHIHRRSPVGAGLLAIAGCQLPGFLTVPSPSRAGSLPQFFRGGRKIHIHRRSPVGASLLAIAVLFDDVDLAYINAAVPGAGCIQGDEYGIAGVDRQVVSVGCLQGDAAFDQVHQFMQLVRPGPAGVRR